MTKRHDLIKQLIMAGFMNKGGANHDKYVKGSLVVPVPRHSEIPDRLAKDILKEAGLR